MSTDCRQYRTIKTTGPHKLLIVKACATVAEVRQGGQCVARPNNNEQRHKAKAVSQCGRKWTLFAAQNFAVWNRIVDSNVL